jgi:hypothetical protein
VTESKQQLFRGRNLVDHGVGKVSNYLSVTLSKGHGSQNMGLFEAALMVLTLSSGYRSPSPPCVCGFYQMEGIAKAKERGVYSGRKATIDVEKVKELKSSGMGAWL